MAVSVLPAQVLIGTNSVNADAPVSSRDKCRRFDSRTLRRDGAPEPRRYLETTMQPQRRALLTFLVAAPGLAAVPAGAGEPHIEQFMSLSRFVTGRAELDADVGGALLAALSEADPGFRSAAESLAAEIALANHADVEALEARVRGTPRHAALLALIAAWYTGSVTVDGKQRFVTLNDAVTYSLIDDGSHIPGVCAGATNSWAGRSRPALERKA